MTALSQFNILDLRKDLPRNPKADPDLGTFAAKTSVTLHFNGPAVRGAGNRDEEIHQLVMDASYHIGKIWGYSAGRALYGNGIMYHLGVLEDGTICQLRDLDCILWHCANGSGNRASMSVHLPIGEGQHPTPAQWSAFGALCDALIADYHMAGRSKVLGHTEWPKFDANGHQIPNSACPGTILLPMLRAWRTGAPAPAAPPLTFYRVIAPQGANVRQGPGVTFPVARTLEHGATFGADKLVFGDAVGGDVRWLHVGDGTGFVSATIVEKA